MTMNEEALNFEIEQASKAQRAKELFLDSYVEARTVDLINEFINIKSSDSSGIFRIKYQLDAVVHLKSTIDHVIQIGSNAIATAEGVQ